MTSVAPAKRWVWEVLAGRIDVEAVMGVLDGGER